MQSVGTDGEEESSVEDNNSMRRNRRVTFETNLPLMKKRDSSFSDEVNEYDNDKRRETRNEEFPDDTRRYSYDDYSNQSSRDSFEVTGNTEKRSSFFRRSSQSLTRLVPRNPSLRALFLFLGTAFTVSGLTVSGYYVYTNLISKSEEDPNAMTTLSPSPAPTNVEPNTIITLSPSATPHRNTVEPSIAQEDNQTGNPTKGEASTKAPTVSQSGNPTKGEAFTKAPTVSQSPMASLCGVDDASFSFLTITGNTQDCAWLTLATDPSINQKRLDNYCVMEDVNTKCCKSCDGFEVDFCLDSLSFTFQITNGNIQDCGWLTRSAKDTQKRINNYCIKQEIEENCPKTCAEECQIE